MTKAELIVRLEGLEGADREVDVSVALAMGWTNFERAWGTLRAFAPKTAFWIEIPAYTASLDAALALVSEKLPGWRWTIGGPYPSGLYRAGFFGSVEADWQAIHAPIYARSPAIAVLIALLKALPEGEAK